MSLSLFKNEAGNWVCKVAQTDEEENQLREDGYFPAGEGPLKDPAKRGPGRPPKKE